MKEHVNSKKNANEGRRSRDNGVEVETEVREPGVEPPSIRRTADVEALSGGVK